MNLSPQMDEWDRFKVFAGNGFEQIKKGIKK